MTGEAHVDLKYYQAVPPRSLGERLVIAARNNMYADFLRECRPGPDDLILDVGVSDVVNDGANMLEQKYPQQHRITAAGLGAASDFRATFPSVSYVQIEPNRPLPFPAKSFDIATANAVLEHVGSQQHQAAFMAELLRVAKTVFVTVPHRFFPIEHHTALPLVHYFDQSFALACRVLNRAEWADEQNLILMTRRRLTNLLPAGINFRVGYSGIRLGVFSSNLYLTVPAN